jgi:hypothetical protein
MLVGLFICRSCSNKQFDVCERRVAKQRIEQLPWLILRSTPGFS